VAVVVVVALHSWCTVIWGTDPNVGLAFCLAIPAAFSRGPRLVVAGSWFTLIVLALMAVEMCIVDPSEKNATAMAKFRSSPLVLVVDFSFCRRIADADAVVVVVVVVDLFTAFVPASIPSFERPRTHCIQNISRND
jgi:hypothetical protein